jgi:molecular chaperone DnaJ
VCGKCRGKGSYIKKECAVCDGTGVVKKTRKLDISIPPGADDGVRLRLEGEGEAAERGGRAGDLYVVLHVKTHPQFERQGTDLLVETHITFPQAAIGAEVEVPTLLSGTAKLKIPAGTQTGTVFRMKGKGIADLHGRGHGDQNVKIIVDTPDKLSKKQKELLEEFDKEGKKKGFFF